MSTTVATASKAVTPSRWVHVSWSPAGRPFCTFSDLSFRGADLQLDADPAGRRNVFDVMSSMVRDEKCPPGHVRPAPLSMHAAHR